MATNSMRILSQSGALFNVCANRMVQISAAVGLLFLYQPAASACVACGDTLSTNWQAQGINTTPGLSLNLAYSYLNQNQQHYGAGRASAALVNRLLAAGQEIEAYTRTQTVTASLFYTTDIWAVTAEVPYVERSHATYGTVALLGASYLDSFQGNIGDIKLLGRYMGFSAQRTAGLIAGIKLPTGSTNMTFGNGSPVDASLQIGTGSTDLIVGGYTSGTVSKLGWFIQGTAQHAMITKAFGGLQYIPGDSFTLNIGIHDAAFGKRLVPMLQMNAVYRRPDGGPAATPADALTGGATTGGTLINLAPGATLRLGGMRLYGFLQIPVYQDTNSLQLTPRYTLTIGVQKSFQ